MALGLAGLFIEAHPDPEQAKCDGPCALPLARLEAYLSQMQQLDQLVKSLPPLDTSAS
jgi:2-dehydro-3-deoxyphosphooctonate aldolase (KDO 8-P synthase)